MSFDLIILIKTWVSDEYKKCMLLMITILAMIKLWVVIFRELFCW